MLFAIDIGNTNIVCGLFEQLTLKGHWRVATDPIKTSDEYGILVSDLFRAAGFQGYQITGVIISSVVPALTSVFEEVSELLFRHKAVIIRADLPLGLTIRLKNRDEIGSDRLVNAAGAFALYPTNLILVDFGTATTFCAVSQAGEYLGGAIAPGIGISAEALFSRTAKLPKVEISKPKSVIGEDTVESIQSGLVFGYIGLVDELVRRIQRELGWQPKVIATGGLANLIAQESQTIQEVRPFLTLEGLACIYKNLSEKGYQP